MVPQLANVFPDMSVRENLEIGAESPAATSRTGWNGCCTPSPPSSRRCRSGPPPSPAASARCWASARALIADPQLLILDEPSAGLAPAVVDEVFAKVKAINAEGVSILMVEQKARQCLALSDYGYVLDMGQNRMEGTGQRPAQRPRGDRRLPRQPRPPDQDLARLANNERR